MESFQKAGFEGAFTHFIYRTIDGLSTTIVMTEEDQWAGPMLRAAGRFSVELLSLRQSKRRQSSSVETE